MEDVLAYLHSKGIQTKRATGSNIHAACIFCGEGEHKRGRLYVNVDPDAEIPGLFFCHLCGQKGSLVTLKRHFGDFDSTKETFSERASFVYKVLQEAAAYYHRALLDERPDIVDWLHTERGLTDETIRKHQIGWADGTLLDWLLAKKFHIEDLKNSHLIVERDGQLKDFLNNMVTIPYVATGSVAMIRGKDVTGKYVTPPGAKTRLYNSDVLFGAREVVVTEGEFDALVLEQMGYAAVGCPGANVWQDAWNLHFSDAKRIYVAFDNDSSGRAGADKLRSQLGHRVRIATIPSISGPEDHNDITAWIVEQGHDVTDVQAIFANASGSLVVTVDDAYLEHQGLQGLAGLKFGYEILDLQIQPGLLPSQVMILLAKTGSGKTLWLLNVFERMLQQKPDAKILFLSLEQTRGEWFERARRIHAFYNMENLGPVTDTPEGIEAFNRENDRLTLNRWRDHIMMVDKNRLSEEEFEAIIEEFEDLQGQRPDVIAIDYLGYWASGFRGRDKYEKVSDAVMSLKAVAKDFRVPIITPHQVSRLAEFGAEPDVDAARDSGVIEETGDFVFTLWSPDSKKGTSVDERTGQVDMRIGKSRHGGKGTIIKYQFSPLTLTLLDLPDPRCREARREVEWDNEFKAAAGQAKIACWEQAIYHHHKRFADVF